MPGADRILVIEDERTHSTPLQQMLEFRGYDVRIIRNGTGATRVVREFGPLVVVIDLMLTDPAGEVDDGYEVTRKLRRLQADLGILVWTAQYASPRDEIRALRAGADDYVRKDAEFGVIEARIEALLRRVKLGRPATGLR